jgi:energy-coupling factor transporter ATP-binding protein EcfA2
MKIFTGILDALYQETMSLLSSFEVHYDKPPGRPDAIVEINNVPIGSAGNLMAITGSEGSGKSNYLGALLAGTMIHEHSNTDLLGMDVARNDKNKAVLFYDTEQSEEQLYKNLNQIVRRAKVNEPPSWFRTYGLVGMSRKDRLLSILQSMDRFYYEYGGIHAVVIDGIADLIDGVNDEERSVYLIEELFRLAAIYKTCIVCVLHLSPSGYKLRGHLGSEIQRKAAGIISIEKDDDKQNSIVKTLKVRDGSPLDIPQVIIGWDDDLKYHVYVGDQQKASSNGRKLKELQSIASDIFSQNTTLSYGNLVCELKERLGIKDRQAKNYVKMMRDQDIIQQNETNSGDYSVVSSVNSDLFSGD